MLCSSYYNARPVPLLSQGLLPGPLPDTQAMVALYMLCSVNKKMWMSSHELEHFLDGLGFLVKCRCSGSSGTVCSLGNKDVRSCDQYKLGVFPEHLDPWLVENQGYGDSRPWCSSYKLRPVPSWQVSLQRPARSSLALCRESRTCPSSQRLQAWRAPACCSCWGWLVPQGFYTVVGTHVVTSHL